MHDLQESKTEQFNLAAPASQAVITSCHRLLVPHSHVNERWLTELQFRLLPHTLLLHVCCPSLVASSFYVTTCLCICLYCISLLRIRWVLCEAHIQYLLHVQRYNICIKTYANIQTRLNLSSAQRQMQRRWKTWSRGEAKSNGKHKRKRTQIVWGKEKGKK